MSSPRRSGPSRKGFARIIRSQGHEGSALILGQRPTSPKGAQCYVGPLAHCGSHCCANCITTGSGRDLPSVARNSVSRGLVLGTAQCNSNGTTSNTDVRRVLRPPYRSSHYGTLYVASMPRNRTSATLLRVTCSNVPFRIRVGERKLIAWIAIVRASSENTGGNLPFATRNTRSWCCFSLPLYMTVSAINLIIHRLSRPLSSINPICLLFFPNKITWRWIFKFH